MPVWWRDTNVTPQSEARLPESFVQPMPPALLEQDPFMTFNRPQAGHRGYANNPAYEPKQCSLIHLQQDHPTNLHLHLCTPLTRLKV
eukprot:5024395-Pyramimonas_sp.AAC.2